jgi:hypothetical protein
LGLEILGPSRAQAGTSIEFFNGYGNPDGALTGKGSAGNGWLTSWQGSSLPKYQSENQLVYSAPWYTNAGNQEDSDDGMINSGAPGAYHLPNPDGVDPDSVVLRSFSGLTSTVWITALTVNSSQYPLIGDGQGTILWLEPNATGVGGNNYVAIRSDVGNATGLPEPVVKYDGLTDGSATSTFARDRATLLLARIEIDLNGTQNDTVTFWVNPTIIGGVGNIEPQAFYTKSGIDIFGSSFDSIGISFASGLNHLDSLRISNTPEGVGIIEGVPEPSGGGLVLIVATCISSSLSRLRRTRC